MLFGKKVITETKEQFALILNPVRGEIAKSRMIERMIEVFPLTLDEASDLVENTPIILLEGLEFETGEQVRNYFRETGADLVLTDDNIFRRKCFRAIWPTPPKFSFLAGKKDSSPTDFPVSEDEKELSSNGHPSISPEPPSTRFESMASRPLPETLITPAEMSASALDSTVAPQMSSQALSDVKPIEQTRDDSWEKDHLHKLELTTANAIQEEKIAYLTQEKERLQALILKLQKENDELKTEHLKALQFKKDLEELRKSLSQLETERVRLSEEVKVRQLEESTLQNKLHELEANRLAFFKEKENEIRLLEERFQRSETMFREERVKAETQFAELKGTIQSQKLEFENGREKLRVAHEELRALEVELKRSRNENSSLRAESEELKRLLAQAQQTVSLQKKEFETVQSHFEEKVIEKTAELESWRRKSEDWSSLHGKLVREIEGLRQRYASEVENVTVRNRELQSQLEIAQRQVREFASVVEQQDLMNKRNRIAVQLSDREAKLKELALRQEMLAHDLRDRDQVLSQVATERDVVEKEILKDRQAQKYIAEQMKLKEKSRIVTADRSNRLKEQRAVDAEKSES